jgi:hypothetical protein
LFLTGSVKYRLAVVSARRSKKNCRKSSQLTPPMICEPLLANNIPTWDPMQKERIMKSSVLNPESKLPLQPIHHLPHHPATIILSRHANFPYGNVPHACPHSVPCLPLGWRIITIRRDKWSWTPVTPIQMTPDCIFEFSFLVFHPCLWVQSHS